MISRGKEVNVQYDHAKAMTDFALEEIFSPKRRTLFQYAEPDLEDAYLQHARKSRPISLSVLWAEYKKRYLVHNVQREKSYPCMFPALPLEAQPASRPWALMRGTLEAPTITSAPIMMRALLGVIIHQSNSL